MARGEGQKGKRRGRYTGGKRIYGTPTQEKRALELYEEWKTRALESTPLKDPVAAEALAETLAALLVTQRHLREQLALGMLTAEEMGKIPSIAGKIAQTCEALKISKEVVDDEDDDF